MKRPIKRGSRSGYQDRNLIDQPQVSSQSGHTIYDPILQILQSTINGRTSETVDDPSKRAAEDAIEQLKQGGTFSQNIGNLGQLDINNSLFQLLTQLAAGNMNISGTYSSDIQKKLLEMMLDNVVKNEQRQFDISALNEQRNYDHPLAQILRLMSTGMSRDAALQAIQGVQQSPLIGSGSEVDSGEPLVSPTETLFNGLQTALGFAGAVSSLVSLGFSIPQALAQTSLLRSQGLLTKKQIAAFDAASEAYNIMNNAEKSITDDTFGNIANVTKSLTSLAKSGNSAAKAFIDNGGIETLSKTAPYSLPFLNQIYRNHRDPSDYNKEFSLRMGNEQAKLDLQEVTTSKMLVEMTAIQDQVDNLHAQSNYYDALAELTGSQKKAQDLQNVLESSWRTDAGMKAYRDQIINNLLFESRKLNEMNDKELWRQQVDTMLKNEEYAQVSLDLCKLYTDGEIGYIDSSSEETKTLLSFCRAAESNGYFDYIRTKVDANTSGNLKVPFFTTTTKALNMVDDIKFNMFGYGFH